MDEPADFRSVLATVLGAGVPNEVVGLLRGLYALHSTAQHVPVIVERDDAFPLSAYLRDTGIDTELHTHSANGSLSGETITVYAPVTSGVRPVVIAGCSSFTHDSVGFRAYKATWQRDHVESTFYDLVFDAPDAVPGTRLAKAVFAFGATLRHQIWVFQGGRWTAEGSLYDAVQASDWDDIVLDDEFKQGLRRDTRTFFESKEIYDDLGIVWKRGILLLGPPGNGKTESIKALLRETAYPALYVKSLTTPYVSVWCL